MSRPASLTRRDLLRAAAVAAVAFSLPGCEGGRQARAVEPYLLALLDRLAVDNPIETGNAYLIAEPFLGGPEQILEQVFGGLPLDQGPEALADAFYLRAAEHFEKGEIVRANGWYLAKNEASFCALLAIDAPLPG